LKDAPKVAWSLSMTPMEATEPGVEVKNDAQMAKKTEACQACPPCPCECGKCCCNSRSSDKGKAVVSAPEARPFAGIEDRDPIDEPLSKRVIKSHQAKNEATEQPPYAEIERLILEVKQTLAPRRAPEPRREIQPPPIPVVPQFQPRIYVRTSPQIPMSCSLPRFQYGTAAYTTSA
jgi:hypothetical protein